MQIHVHDCQEQMLAVVLLHDECVHTTAIAACAWDSWKAKQLERKVENST